MSKHAAIAVLAGIALAGCAAETPLAPVPGAPVPLAKYDGSYQGRATLVSTPGTGCPAGRYGVIVVGDHTVNFAYQPDVVFVADVAQDGTIHDTAHGATLDGKIADGTLSMTITTPSCKSVYAASFIWNHS